MTRLDVAPPEAEGPVDCDGPRALVVAARLVLANRRTTAELDAGEALDEEAPLRSYSYQELEDATWSFREPLGRGAFGTVFRGTLPHNGEKAIAVKRLEKMVEEGEVEFQREVRAIGRTSHRNLVRLLGFCHEGAREERRRAVPAVRRAHGHRGRGGLCQPGHRQAATIVRFYLLFSIISY